MLAKVLVLLAVALLLATARSPSENVLKDDSKHTFSAIVELMDGLVKFIDRSISDSSS